MNKRIIPVVLAGGGGTRLWPLSREQFPKQYLKLDSDKTLLQDTFARLNSETLKSSDFKIGATLVICNEDHRFLVAEQARECAANLSKIVLEPTGRNTAPALTIAALMQDDPESILVMMPADHKISDRLKFGEAVLAAAELADLGYLVTFGILPAGAETGYGYIQYGDVLSLDGKTGSAFAIHRFVEKPDREAAERYLQEGNYLWNSGIFVMKSAIWLEAIRNCSPEILTACQKSLAAAKVDADFLRLGEDAFKACPTDSIDYAVMEKLDKSTDISSAVIKLDTFWSDVGSWKGIWEISSKDENGNVMTGDVHAIDTGNSLIMAENRFISTLGINDMVIVETADAVMVASRERSQDVKEIVSWLKEHSRQEAALHRKVYRPWGSYDTVDKGDCFQVKRITVNPGHSLSLQLHRHRAEHWIVVRGTAEVVIGEENITLQKNESTYIPIGVKHRLSNRGESALEIIEVQSGSYLGEDDIVRFEDIYNRN